MISYITLDVGGSKILGGLFDQDGTILDRVKVKTFASKGTDFVLDQIRKVIDELRVQTDSLKGIAVIVPGIVEDKRRVVMCPNVPLEQVNLASILEEEYGVPVKLGNDVSLAIYGEWKSQEEQSDNVVGIFLGTGVGGGLILNKNLYEGRGAAGEIGHMVVQPMGRRCGCGQEGCLEAYASKSGMYQQMLAERDRGRASSFYQYIPEDGSMVKSSSFEKALEAGDELTEEVIMQGAYYLGKAVATLANVLHVDQFIFGGGMTDNIGDFMLPKALKIAKESSMPSIRDSIRFTRSHLGDDAGIVGGFYFISEGEDHA